MVSLRSSRIEIALIYGVVYIMIVAISEDILFARMDQWTEDSYRLIEKVLIVDL